MRLVVTGFGGGISICSSSLSKSISFSPSPLIIVEAVIIGSSGEGGAGVSVVSTEGEGGISVD